MDTCAYNSGIDPSSSWSRTALLTRIRRMRHRYPLFETQIFLPYELPSDKGVQSERGKQGTWVRVVKATEPGLWERAKYFLCHSPIFHFEGTDSHGKPAWHSNQGENSGDSQSSPFCTHFKGDPCEQEKISPSIFGCNQHDQRTGLDSSLSVPGAAHSGNKGNIRTAKA